MYGWNGVQNCWSFFCISFWDAAFPKCHFHLSGWLHQGCCFSPTRHPGHPLPRHMHTWWGYGPHSLELKQMPQQQGMCLLRQGCPCLIWTPMSFGILGRRSSPGFVLLQPPYTLSLSAQSWSSASSHCLISETLSLGSSWMPPLSRHAARTRESVLCAGSSVPRNPRDNLIATGLCWALSDKALWDAKLTDGEDWHTASCSPSQVSSQPMCFLRTEILYSSLLPKEFDTKEWKSTISHLPVKAEESALNLLIHTYIHLWPHTHTEYFRSRPLLQFHFFKFCFG